MAAGAGRRLGLLHLPLLCGAPERKLPEGDGHARSPRGAEPALLLRFVLAPEAPGKQHVGLGVPPPAREDPRSPAPRRWRVC